MRKILIALALSFSLAGCASLSIPNPFKVNNLYEVEASVGIVRAAVDGYFSLRQCKKREIISASNVCSRYSIKLQLQKADANLQIALVEARAFVKNNPTLNPISVISAAQSALSAFQTIALNNGIRVQ